MDSSDVDSITPSADLPIIFTTFGLTVLDEIRHPTLGVMHNVLGGSGTFAILGARLLVGSNASRSLGWPLSIGNDFPADALETIRGWNTTLFIQKSAQKPSTRGLLEYQDSTFGPKIFQYTSERLTVSPNTDLPDPLKRSAAFHLLAGPEAFERQIDDLIQLRQNIGLTSNPLIVWEPAPPTCTPEMLEGYCMAARKASIFSPNHIELARLFGITDPSEAFLTRTLLESLALKFMNLVGDQSQFWLVLRAGERGCLVTSASSKPQWFPAYHSHTQNSVLDKPIVDPTGAGNAFLGAFAVGYLHTGDIFEAVCYGAVGAGFAIEQIGLPSLQCEDTGERWNGTQVEQRLNIYKEKVQTEARS